MIIDHICFAVKNLSKGIPFWENTFGYKQCTGIVENSRQKVKVAFLSKENSILIKLIEPLEDNLSIKSFISKGGSFHHVCFKCSDLEAEIDNLKNKGLFMLVPPQPGEAFNNNNIAFMLAKNGLNIELIDTDDKAALLEL